MIPRILLTIKPQIKPLFPRPTSLRSLPVLNFHPPGLGYTGLAVANYFKQKGFKVSGTCTSAEKQHNLKLRGFIDTFLFDPDNDLFLNTNTNNTNQDPSSSSSPALSALLSSNYILSTIPPSLSAIPFPPDDTILASINHTSVPTTTTTPSTIASILDTIDPVLAQHTSDIVSNPNLQWIGYISSTSVYGNYDGNWVDEFSPLKCTFQKGIARAYAEQAWLNVFTLTTTTIFRCGGIYGPGRSALDIVKRQQQEEEQKKKMMMMMSANDRNYHQNSSNTRTNERKRSRQRYTSRIHVLDICRCIDASITRQENQGTTTTSSSNNGKSDSAGYIYNVVDDDPSPRGEVVAFARHLLLGTDLSNNNDDDDSTSSSTENNASNGGEGRISMTIMEEKRVHNRLIKQELGVTLEFPTYRQGLNALASGDVRPYND